MLDPVDRLRLSAIRMSGMKAQRHEVATPPRFALTARFATSMLYILKSLQPNSGWRGARADRSLRGSQRDWGTR